MTDPYQTDPAADVPVQAPTAPVIPSFALYRVDARSRINLAGVVGEGVEFYTANRNDDGTIVLTPVSVVTTTIKRTASGAGADDDA